MTADTDPNEVSVSFDNPQEVTVIHWFLQQRVTLERMLGVPISAISLQYSDAGGVTLNYTKAPVAQPSQPVAGSVITPQ